MKKKPFEIAVAALWAIAIAHTIYFVRDAEAEAILITLFFVCMVGNIQIVRYLKRNIP